jgi:hypothetical protein
LIARTIRLCCFDVASSKMTLAILAFRFPNIVLRLISSIPAKVYFQ